MVVSCIAGRSVPAVRLHRLSDSNVLAVNLTFACSVRVMTAELVVKFGEAHPGRFFDVWAFGPSERKSSQRDSLDDAGSFDIIVCSHGYCHDLRPACCFSCYFWLYF